MSMSYIRRYYNVPAKRGKRIKYKDKSGRITGAAGPHLRVLLDGEKKSKICHPTWQIEYVQESKTQELE